MRILVTGSAGFIGQHLIYELVRKDHDVVGWDLSNSALEEIAVFPDRFAQHLRQTRPDVVVHLAAKVGRVFGEDDPLDTIKQNAGVTALVAQACGDQGVRLAYASTSEVYGDTGAFDDGIAVDDFTDPSIQTKSGNIVRLLPHNLYGLSKRWGEEACLLYAPDRLTIWRISMPYGPGLPAGRGRAAIVNMLYQALHRQPITVHNGAERSWCWVGDTVRALRMTIERSEGGVWNVGRDDNAHSMLFVAAIACDLVDADVDELVDHLDAPLRQTVVKRLSTSKLRSIGWKPRVELREGMARTLEWVRTLPPPKGAA